MSSLDRARQAASMDAKITPKHGLGDVFGMFVGLFVGLLPIANFALQRGNSYYRTQ